MTSSQTSFLSIATVSTLLATNSSEIFNVVIKDSVFQGNQLNYNDDLIKFGALAS